MHSFYHLYTLKISLYFANIFLTSSSTTTCLQHLPLWVLPSFHQHPFHPFKHYTLAYDIYHIELFLSSSTIFFTSSNFTLCLQQLLGHSAYNPRSSRSCNCSLDRTSLPKFLDQPHVTLTSLSWHSHPTYRWLSLPIDSKVDLWTRIEVSLFHLVIFTSVRIVQRQLQSEIWFHPFSRLFAVGSRHVHVRFPSIARECLRHLSSISKFLSLHLTSLATIRRMSRASTAN